MKPRKVVDDPDNPELDANFFARAKRIPDGPEALSAALRASAAEWRRRRGKQKAPTKRLVSLRIDAEVLDAYRGTGKGWQTRIAADLARSARRLLSPSRRKKGAAA